MREVRYLGDFLRAVSKFDLDNGRLVPTFMYVTISTNRLCQLVHHAEQLPRATYRHNARLARTASQGRSCCTTINISNVPPPFDTHLSRCQIDSDQHVCTKVVRRETQGALQLREVQGVTWTD